MRGVVLRRRAHTAKHHGCGDYSLRSVANFLSHVPPALTLTIMTGIALYTYHKYKKSMQKDVALDPHGNPLLEDDGDLSDEPVALETGDFRERQRLTLDDEDDDRADEERRDNRVSFAPCFL